MFSLDPEGGKKKNTSPPPFAEAYQKRKKNIFSQLGKEEKRDETRKIMPGRPGGDAALIRCMRMRENRTFLRSGSSTSTG